MVKQNALIEPSRKEFDTCYMRQGYRLNPGHNGLVLETLSLVVEIRMISQIAAILSFSKTEEEKREEQDKIDNETKFWV